jgi:peptidyl-prolyl cis-trans isomerase SurA
MVRVKDIMHFLFLACLAFATFVTTPATAQRVTDLTGGNNDMPVMQGQATAKIAAIVNEDVITKSDLDSRLALALFSAGLPPADDVLAKIAPQVLSSLIDETLQIQEARRLNLAVTPEEIEQALRQLAADNNLADGDIRGYLASNGVPPETIVAQGKAIIAWSKVAQREFRPRIDIGEDEVDAAIEKMQANAGKQEYWLNEIYLAVDTSEDDTRVKELAESLAKQLNEGANFGTIAQQFSQNGSALQGGDIGWVQEGQLPRSLDDAVQKIEAGGIGGPIRGPSGYHIFGVREKRMIAMGDPESLMLRAYQFTYQLDGIRSREEGKAEATRLGRDLDGCDDAPERLRRDYPAWQIAEYKDIALKKLNPAMQTLMKNMPIGRVSDLIVGKKRISLLMVCDRKTTGGPDRAAVTNNLGLEKMEMLARRKMRDLRRTAFIDVRLGKE